MLVPSKSGKRKTPRRYLLALRVAVGFFLCFDVRLSLETVSRTFLLVDRRENRTSYHFELRNVTVCHNVTPTASHPALRQRRSLPAGNLVSVWKRYRASLARPDTSRDAFNPALKGSKAWLKSQIPKSKPTHSTLAWLNSLNARVVTEHTEDVASGGRKTHVDREIADLLWEGQGSGRKAPPVSLQRLHSVLKQLARLRKKEKADVAHRWPDLVKRLQRLQKPAEAAQHLQEVLRSVGRRCTTRQVHVRLPGPAGNATLSPGPRMPHTSGELLRMLLYRLSFYWGYAAANVLCALKFDLHFRPKRVFACGVFVSCLISILLPFAVRRHVAFITVLRVVQGFAEGVLPSASHRIWVKWAPPHEICRLTTIANAGIALGIALGFVFAPLCIRYLNWRVPFFVYGGAGIIWFILWLRNSQDSPAEDPDLSEEEKSHIEKTIDDDHKAKKAELRKMAKGRFALSPVG